MIKPPTSCYPPAARLNLSHQKNTNWLVDLSPALFKLMAKPMFNPNINQHVIFLEGFVLLGILYIFLVEGFCGWYGGTPNEPHHEMCDVNIADFHAVTPLRSASHNKSQEMQNKKEIHQGLLGAPTD